MKVKFVLVAKNGIRKGSNPEKPYLVKLGHFPLKTDYQTRDIVSILAIGIFGRGLDHTFL